MKSRTYQLSSTPDETNAGDEANFSHAIVRLLPAEVLLDAISQVVGVAGAVPARPASPAGRPASRAHRAESRF